MKRIVKFGGKGKVEKAQTVEIRRLQEYGALALDAKAAIIQELIPLGPMHILEVIEEEVVSLAGDRYRRNGRLSYDRWGRQKGSVYINDQRIPIKYQRARNTDNNTEAAQKSYGMFQRPTGPVNEKLLKRIIHGISCGNYRMCS
ncbi:MAG: hypothetical protein HY894_07970 [Deltaproteobacteria bacterium]|nr:hypothetical protein [Deltaproteobacteria bacterium]